MSAVSFGTKTIGRRRYPTVNDQGTQVLDTSQTPTSTIIEGCWYEPIQMQVEKEGRIAILDGYRVTAPAGTELDPFTDHVVIGGIEYELESVQDVPSPTGALDEVLFSCRRWKHAG